MLILGKLLQGRYSIGPPLGRGGMGAVYEAMDERLGIIVAVKELIAEGEELRRAFEREARLLARLSHPALPRVIDHFSEGESQYLVMDFLPGDDVKTLLDRSHGPFPVGDVLRWADQLLAVLEYLHGREPPVHHRDIKPANLKVLPDGRICLLDFGLARGGLGQTCGTASRSVFGYSLHFAPLEQINGERSSPRSDLYSLSATLYRLLTGCVPFDALTRATAIFNDEQDPLIPPDALNPDVPAAVASLIVSGLALKSAARPASAAEMRAGLKLAPQPEPADRDDDVTRSPQDELSPRDSQPATTRTAPPEPAVAPAPVPAAEERMPRAGDRVSRSLWRWAAALCMLAAFSTGGYVLLASRMARPVGPPVRSPAVALTLPPQFKPAADALLSVTAADADERPVAGGGGLFVTPTEALVPLSAIEGATTASAYTADPVPPRPVAHVTRVDRVRGLAILKVAGEAAPPPGLPVGAPPSVGEKIKLLSLGPDAAIRMAAGSVNVTGPGGLVVSADDEAVGPGWVALRESGEFVGLLVARSPSGGFTLFTWAAVAELMKTKTSAQAVDVVGAKEVLFDSRAPDFSTDPPVLGLQEQAAIFGAVFGPPRPLAAEDTSDECEAGNYDQCLAADRFAGRIEPEVLARTSGSFTQVGTQQVAYLIAANEEHAADPNSYGTRRLAIFEGQHLILSFEVGDFQDMPKTFDLNRDGTSELLLTGGYSETNRTVWWAKLIDLRRGKPTTVKDFGKIHLANCGDDEGSMMYGTSVLYTAARQGAFPSDFRKDVYSSGCSGGSWNYLSKGKMPTL